MNIGGHAFQADSVRDMLTWVVTARTSGVPKEDTLVVVFLARDEDGGDRDVAWQAMSLRGASARLNELRAIATMSRATRAFIVVFDEDEAVADTVSNVVATNLHLDAVRVQVGPTLWRELTIGAAQGEHGVVEDLASSSMAAQTVVAGLPFPQLGAPR